MNTWIIVPCYNEAERFSREKFRELIDLIPDARVLFVDDGSSDRTVAMLGDFCRAHQRAEFLSLPENQGKGEAVRAGLLHAYKKADLLSYIDADLACPPAEIARLLSAFKSTPTVDLLVGTRVGLLGWDIERKLHRHYFGRIFATMASMVLGIRIYDTQCGAKFMRTSEKLLRAISEPFCSRWFFDIELIGKLHKQRCKITEEPLRVWHDIGGTKRRLSTYFIAALDLIRIKLRLRAFSVEGTSSAQFELDQGLSSN